MNLQPHDDGYVIVDCIQTNYELFFYVDISLIHLQLMQKGYICFKNKSLFTCQTEHREIIMRIAELHFIKNVLLNINVSIETTQAFIYDMK